MNENSVEGYLQNTVSDSCGYLLESSQALLKSTITYFLGEIRKLIISQSLIFTNIGLNSLFTFACETLFELF